MSIRFGVNVDVALHRDGQWLLIVRGDNEEHAPGSLSLPGGTLDLPEGDDVLEATARRELAEEVGVVLDGRTVLHPVENSAFRLDSTGHPVLNLVFAAELPLGAEPRVTAADEVAAMAWWTLEDLAADESCPPWTLRAVRRADEVLRRAARDPVGA